MPFTETVFTFRSRAPIRRCSIAPCRSPPATSSSRSACSCSTSRWSKPRPGGKGIMDHLLSFIVFLAMAAELLLVPRAAAAAGPYPAAAHRAELRRRDRRPLDPAGAPADRARTQRAGDELRRRRSAGPLAPVDEPHPGFRDEAPPRCRHRRGLVIVGGSPDTPTAPRRAPALSRMSTPPGTGTSGPGTRPAGRHVRALDPIWCRPRPCQATAPACGCDPRPRIGLPSSRLGAAPRPSPPHPAADFFSRAAASVLSRMVRAWQRQCHRLSPWNHRHDHRIA